MIVKESKHYKRISETKSKFVGGFCQTDLFRSILGAEWREKKILGNSNFNPCAQTILYFAIPKNFVFQNFFFVFKSVQKSQ